MSALEDHLASTELVSFRTPGTILELDAGTSFLDALQALHDKGVSGAPVFREEVSTVSVSLVSACARSPALRTLLRHSKQPRHVPIVRIIYVCL